MKVSTGIAPLVLNLDANWRWVADMTSQSLCTRKKNPSAHWIGKFVGRRAGLDFLRKIKISSHCGDSKAGSSSHYTDFTAPDPYSW